MEKAKKRRILPLLDVLQSLSPDRMKIVIGHLDNQTRDAIHETLAITLTSSKVPEQRRKLLRRRLKTYKDDLRRMMTVRQGPCTKRRNLMQMGGGPMKAMLKAAIPLLLSSVKPATTK